MFKWLFGKRYNMLRDVKKSGDDHVHMDVIEETLATAAKKAEEERRKLTMAPFSDKVLAFVNNHLTQLATYVQHTKHQMCFRVELTSAGLLLTGFTTREFSSSFSLQVGNTGAAQEGDACWIMYHQAKDRWNSEWILWPSVLNWEDYVPILTYIQQLTQEQMEKYFPGCVVPEATQYSEEDLPHAHDD